MNNNVRTVTDVSGMSYIVYSGANLSGKNFTGANLKYLNLSGINFTGANFTDANLRYANFVYTDNDEIKPAILRNVTWPKWIRYVLYGGALLTDTQMRELDNSNPSARINGSSNNYDDSFISNLIEQKAVKTNNLQSRVEELEDKPDIGYGECPICLQGFQPDEIVVDVHPDDNEPYDKHRFHKKCILPVCNNREPECPICRKAINCENIPEFGEPIINRLQGGKRKTKNSRKVKKTNKRRKSNKRRKTKRRYRK